MIDEVAWGCSREAGPARPRIVRTMAGAGVLAALLLWGAPTRAQCPTPFAELNGDGLVNVVDAQCGIVAALDATVGEVPDCLGGDPAAADVNCDGAVNVNDVQLVITAALSLPLAHSVDANGNTCPDACELLPTDPGAQAPSWQLEDFQPKSVGYQDTYGMEAFEGKVTVVALLASW